MLENSYADERGNIRFTRGEGVILSFEEHDETGEIVDPATHPRFFNIPEIMFREEVGVDPSNSQNYRLVLTPSLAESIAKIGGATFSLTDEQTVVSGTVIPVSIWSGTINQRNLSL
jgi:hypothetical protein